MSTLTSPETRPAADTRTPPRSYAGTGSLIRLTLRRERIPLLVWVVGIAAFPASFLAGWIWQRYSPAAPFAFSSVLSFTAAVLLLFA